MQLPVQQAHAISARRTARDLTSETGAGSQCFPVVETQEATTHAACFSTPNLHALACTLTLSTEPDPGNAAAQSSDTQMSSAGAQSENAQQFQLHNLSNQSMHKLSTRLVQFGWPQKV